MKTLQYERTKIKEIKEYETGYEITWGNGLVFVGVEKKYGVVPHIGDRAEIYGEGMAVYGLCIEGKTVYFKGEIEREKEHQAWLENYKREKIETFEKQKDQLD